MNDSSKNLSKIFILSLAVLTIYLCYLIFKPFLDEIIISAILVVILYPLHLKLTNKLNGKKHLSALIMCIGIALIIIIPTANFIILASQKSIVAYNSAKEYFSKNNFNKAIEIKFLKKVDYLGLDSATIKKYTLNIIDKVNQWLISGATNIIKGTTSFITSLFLIILAVYFFFTDGERIIKKIMQLTPLENKYDIEIFKKFQSVSYSIILSIFIVAIAQGIVGAIGFMIIGLPAFFAGLAISFFSVIPYFGSSIVWFPVGIYLLYIGDIWQGIFLLVWGFFAISSIDNILRAYIIKGKAEVNPIILIFAILGSISLFGFWGIIYGPLIIALTITILHIYEIEYQSILEK